MVVQADGRIIIGGTFISMRGQPRNFIARLNADGSLDMNFNPGTNSFVQTLKMQTDGKILVGGDFTMLDGQTRERIARLNADGTIDTDFNTMANIVSIR